MTDNPLRALPAIDTLLHDAAALVERYGRPAVVTALRTTLDQTRAKLRAGEPVLADQAAILDAAAIRLARDFQPTLRPVINATGIILHTNLGRAPLSDAAQAAITQAAANYSTLEYDLDAGKRGSRLTHPERALQAVTGAEAALVVNNNASAVLLILSALAHGREVIISRGQLIEIGGGFRIPDVLAQSGAHLVEVGTTNKTRLADFERALTPAAALLLRAHASNFKQIGFVEAPPLDGLAKLAHKHGALLIDDVGSGALLDTAVYGLDHEPTVQESLAAGADLVAFSGDKLLGAPQAGIIVGKAALIDKLKRHPLARAMRADKLCLAGLIATLDHYRKGEAVTHIPVWRMIAAPLDKLVATAQAWANEIGGGAAAQVIVGESLVGGGSLPGATLPTVLLALDVPNATDFAAKLRAADPPVIARVADGRVLFDPRTVLPAQAPILTKVLYDLYNS